MTYQAGFIGVGNMGSALAAAVYQSAPRLALCDHTPAKAQAAADKLPQTEVVDIETLARESAFIFLGVKPNVILKTAESLRPLLQPGTVLVSMAVGVTLEALCEAAQTDRVIRIMPNTPAAVGQGVVLYCCAEGITESDEKTFLSLMQHAGLVDSLKESLFDAASSLSGCGPAFVFMFAQALADGAVACGVPRAKAEQYAAQTLLGSAALLLESGKHPEKLKDEVCSPGGTTIEGVLAMEKSGFRYASAEAVRAAYEKTLRMKK